MSQSPTTQRGLILIEQKRYAEAVKYFRESLAVEPNDHIALFHLALCELSLRKPAEALSAVERALSLEPDHAASHALRSYTLTGLRRYKEALTASDEALRLDPDSDFAFTARAAAYLAQNEWAKAEEAARQALALNPENDTAANQLAHSLRLQNKIAESAEQTAYMLSQDPDSADNHNTAGWLALQKGDHRKAEEHFLEALRLDASSEPAREGLKEAFRARSPVYRTYLRYCFLMQRFTQGKQWLVILGLVFGMQVVKSVFHGPIGYAIWGLYMLFVLWVHVARGVGNFQIALDRTARYALDLREKLEAWFVGAAVLLGLIMVPVGLLANQTSLFLLGMTMICAAFPLARTFTNASRPGQFVFGGIAVFIYAVGLLLVFGPLVGPVAEKFAAGMIPIALLSVVAVTWLCNVPSLYRRS